MAWHLIVLITSCGLPLISFWFSPILTKEILKDLRIPRILHYVALANIGMALSLKNFTNFGVFLQNEGLFSVLILIFSLVYAAIFAIVTNNIEDVPTDTITNPNRPLVLGKIRTKDYLRVGIFCQTWALVLAYALSIYILSGILAISLGYYLYSCSPFRLKRIPILAKLIIGFNSFAIAWSGWVLVGGSPNQFPIKWMLFIMIPLSLAANFVDLKDTEGDKLMNVKTLPVLLGQEKATHLIAGFTLMSYVIAGILLANIWLFIPTLFMAFLHIYFLYQKPYIEKPVFLIYVSSLFGLAVFLLF